MPPCIKPCQCIQYSVKLSTFCMVKKACSLFPSKSYTRDQEGLTLQAMASSQDSAAFTPGITVKNGELSLLLLQSYHSRANRMLQGVKLLTLSGYQYSDNKVTL